MSDQESAPPKKKNRFALFFAVLFVLTCGGFSITLVVYNALYSRQNITLEFQQKEIDKLKTTIVEKSQTIKQLNSHIKLRDVITQFNRNLDPEIVDIYAVSISKHAKNFGFPPTLIASVIKFESNFNPIAVSSKGARGPMQIMLDIHKAKLKENGWGRSEATHIDQLGCQILREYYDQTNGSIVKALTKYVGGTHEKYVNNIMQAYIQTSILPLKMVTKETKEVPTDDRSKTD